METCAGCGAELAPTWKYCIHCGVAVDRTAKPVDVPGAIRPATDDTESAGDQPAASERSSRNVNVALLVGGITAFVVAVAFIGLAIAYAVGALK
jgi:hypothetical protein